MRTAILLLGCIGVLALSAGPVRAELYSWMDESGTVHLSDDPGAVPESERSSAAERASAALRNRPIQVVAPTGYQLVASTPVAASVPVERFGRLMRVTARLNGKLEAPFVIDTGADGLVIPRRLAGELGLLSDGRSQNVTVTTANGRVAMPRVELASVEVGAARVQGVHAVVNPQLEIGLLGLAFLRHFRYTIDLERGLLLLERRPNSLR